MRQLLLPIFVGWLIIKTTPFLLLHCVVVIKSHLSTSLLISLILLLICSTTIIANLTNHCPTNFQFQSCYSQTDSPTNHHQNQLIQMQQLLNHQPTHRDILYNLSRLYSADHQPQLAQQYFNQAQQLDPNHSFFRDVKK